MKKRVKRKGRPSVIEKNTADFNKEFRSESVSRVGVERGKIKKKKNAPYGHRRRTSVENERKEKKRIKRKEKGKKKEGEIGKFSPFFHLMRLFGKRTTIATTTRRLNALGQLSRRQVHGYEGLID